MAKTVKEMRDTLYETVKYHGCYFKKTDLHFKKKNGNYTIVVEDYEHVSFRLILSDLLDDKGMDLVIYADDEILDILPAYDKAYGVAMKEIGHYIGNRF